jgi:hypothetical protein
MEERIQKLENGVSELKERNRKVETDKAWEVSFSRRIFIAVSTYIVAGVWLVLIKDSVPWLKAFVPSVGYLLSTLSLPIIKNKWSKSYGKEL